MSYSLTGNIIPAWDVVFFYHLVLTGFDNVTNLWQIKMASIRPIVKGSLKLKFVGWIGGLKRAEIR